MKIEVAISENVVDGISQATNEKYEHEALFYTKDGLFIIYHYSQWLDTEDVHTVVSVEDAFLWILKNNFSKKQFNNIIDSFSDQLLRELTMYLEKKEA